MEERERFIEQLGDMVEQARISGNALTAEEIRCFFEDITLTPAQLEHIYAYLAAHQITVKGYIPKFSAAEPKAVRLEEPEESSDSTLLQVYLTELKAIKRATAQEEAELLERVLKGEEEAIKRYMEIKLGQVVGIARKCLKSGILIEDLIQEGNLCLMAAVRSLAERRPAHVESFLNEQVEKGLKRYMEESYEMEDAEQLMVSKVNFVSEVAKNLKEENGIEPTVMELAAFTNMTAEEITAIMKLSADNLEA